jgi:hypothetical protein
MKWRHDSMPTVNHQGGVTEECLKEGAAKSRCP